MHSGVVLLGLVALAASLVDAEKCANDRYPCATSNSQCNSIGKCECNDPTVGIAPLACVKGKFCAIFSDPNGKSYAGEPFNVPIKVALPCKFSASQYEVSYNEDNGDTTFCSVKVNTAMKKVRGKMFLHGYEAIVQSERYVADTETTHKMSLKFRQTGTGSSGSYNFVYEIGFGSAPYTPFTGFDANQLEALPNTNWGPTTQGRTSLFIPVCETEILFRPVDYDSPTGSSSMMPGLMVVNLNDAVTKFTFPEKDFCMSTNPKQYDLAQAFSDTSASDNEGAFTIRMLRDNTLMQDFPDTPVGECAALMTDVQSMSDSSDLQMSEKGCRFIFNNENFINCYSRKGHEADLVSFYNRCMNTLYGIGVETCDDLWADIVAKECQAKTPGNWQCNKTPPATQPQNTGPALVPVEAIEGQ